MTPRIRLLLFPVLCFLAATGFAVTCTPNGGDRTVTVCTPTNGATVTSPFEVSAAATDSAAVSAMQIYLDGVKVFQVNANSFDTSVTASTGTHRLTVKAWDAVGAFSQTLSVTVTAGGSNTPPFGWLDYAKNASDGSTTVAQGGTLSIVGWAADKEDGAPVAKVQVFVDNVLVGNAALGDARPDVANAFNNPAYTNSGWHLNYVVPNTLAAGSHSVSAIAFDSAGASTLLPVGQNNTFTVTTGGSNTPPFGWLDYARNAANGTTTVAPGGTLSVVGWAADKEDGAPVAKVQISIDGSLIGNAVLGDPRPDVANALNNPAYTNSGWHLNYTVPATLAAGTHNVTAVAFDSAGASTTLSIGQNGSNFTVSSGGGDITSLKHIIFMIEENRSFDTYFGQLDQYRVQQGLAGGAVDGLPPEGTGACSQPGLAGYTSPASGCMPTNLQDNSYSTTIKAFHLQTMCIENTSNAWFEAHVDFDLFSSASSTPTMDGFAWSAGGDALSNGTNDTIGMRAMGYYDWNDLIYHYFMATQFATSDRWFSPGPMETEPSKMYYVAATSHGHAHAPTTSVNIPTIFSLLQNAGISWKVYYAGSSNQPILNFFQPFASNFASHIQPIANYFSDLQNGTLPQVVMIEPAFSGGRNEHPGTGNNIQQGVAESASYINALMSSSAWTSSVFITTFDEAGGLYDHVPSPTNVPNPDGIPPQDLFTGSPADQPGDFTRTGFRVPLLVVSPFAKKHYVSHSVTDGTAILHLIETRFGLPQLTKRDAWAIDMTEFFDFSNPPWMTPPTPPTQPQNGACYDGLP